MSKQKITEQELLARVAKLQEHMDQSVEEGWWGDNMPEFLGGDPAKSPMKMAVTPKNYARVQKMLPAMYAAAKVDPNADEIVKQRFGVYLPPFEKWDGTVPSGRGDFLTRNVFGRDGAAAAEAEGTKAQQAETERLQRLEVNAKKLTNLFSKLKELVPGAFAEKTEEPPAAVATPVKESLAESMKRLSLMISEQEQVADAPAEAIPAGHPADALIKEINDTIAAIEADDPDEEDLEMVNAVKEKVAQCQNVIKQEAEAAKKSPATNDAAPAKPAGSFDSCGNPVDQGSAAANNADPTGQVEADKIANRMDAEAGANTVGQPAASAQNMINTTWQKIYDLNKNIIGNNPNLIKPGQKFELPDGKGSYTVVPGDTLSGIAAGQGKGTYETNAQPAPKLPVPVQPKNDSVASPSSTTGTYKHLDVADPKIKALQAKADSDPNNASFTTTVREDQSLARIISLARGR